MSNNTDINKEQIDQCFQEFKASADKLINLANKAKEENNGVLPEEYVQAIRIAKEALQPFKNLQSQ